MAASLAEFDGVEVLLDPGRLRAASERFGDFGREGFWDRISSVASNAADPERAVGNFERWLASGGSAEMRAGIVDDSTPLAFRLLTIFGTSQTISNELIRDPDAAMMLFDSHEISEPIVANAVRAEALRLFSSSISFQHKLDQLRFLQKRSLAKLVWQDLTGEFEAESVWTSLSELADGLLMGALDACAEEYGFEIERLAVIAMGKHGSRELNYASDIDLVFVLDDAVEDIDGASRFCERFVRSLSGKMGRGDLYRVDLRLRPFGKSGPVAHTLTAFTKYFENYAQPWEMVSLVRMRACAGSAELGDRFMRMAEDQVYRGPRSDWFFDSLIATKRLTEQTTQDSQNVKFAAGGIRDIEFIVQTLQLVAGREMPELRGASTIAAIATLEREGLVRPNDARTLASAYRFFRQLEHRIQLTHAIHSHSLPKGDRDRLVLARAMGVGDWRRLESVLSNYCARVRAILLERFPAVSELQADSADVGEMFGYGQGSREAAALQRLVSGMTVGTAAPDLFADEAIRNRVDLIVRMAPRVISDIAFHKELWDIAFSEEIEFSETDDDGLIAKWREELNASGDKWKTAMASLARHASVAACVKQAYHRDVVRSGRFQTAAADVMLSISLDRCSGSDMDIVALGGYGSRELLHGSDWDVMLLATAGDDSVEHEKVGELWMRAIRQVAIGSPFPVDARLRPGGRSGLMVSTPASLSRYAGSSMEPWERLAYTRARSVRSLETSVAAIRKAAYSRAWTSTDESEALHLRARVHAERLHPAKARRDVKLGPGSLFDIEWLVALLKLRSDTCARNCLGTAESLAGLAQERAITVLERDALARAHAQFSLLRNAMYLLEMESDSVLPENPDKLKRIACWLGIASANDLLQDVDDNRKEVQAVFHSILGDAGP